MSIQNSPVVGMSGAAPVVTNKQTASGSGASNAPATPVPTVHKIAPKQPPANDTLRQVAADMEKFVRESGRNLQFQVDDGTGIVVVRVVDAVSGDLIRQIPSEEFLQLARSRRTADSDVSCIVDACA